MSGRDLPLGISVRQMRLEDNVAGVYFEIARNGQRVAFGLDEGDAIAVALAILGVSIEIRDAGSPMWRPRLIEGGRAAPSGPIKP